MDVDRDGEVEAGVSALIARHGRIDAVVTAAGWGLAGPVETTPFDDARAQLETNFWGTVRVVSSALPFMRSQGAGRIVLVSSIGGVIGLPFQAYYSASKFAVEGFGETLAYEVAPFGIRVTMVQPGNIRTDFTASRRMAGMSTGSGGAAAGSADADPYSAAVAKAIGVMENDESNGAPASDVARVVERVLLARNPRRRVSVGKAGERVGIAAKRILPHRLFEKAASSSLGV
jgi:NAD(P)-dependent dehydrogenase (short-subunit alcohol dehydrogenase family)